MNQVTVFPVPYAYSLGMKILKRIACLFLGHNMLDRTSVIKGDGWLHRDQLCLRCGVVKNDARTARVPAAMECREMNPTLFMAIRRLIRR